VLPLPQKEILHFYKGSLFLSPPLICPKGRLYGFVYEERDDVRILILKVGVKKKAFFKIKFQLIHQVKTLAWTCQ